METHTQREREHRRRHCRRRATGPPLRLELTRDSLPAAARATRRHEPAIGLTLASALGSEHMRGGLSRCRPGFRRPKRARAPPQRWGLSMGGCRLPEVVSSRPRRSHLDLGCSIYPPGMYPGMRVVCTLRQRACALHTLGPGYGPYGGM